MVWFDKLSHTNSFYSLYSLYSYYSTLSVIKKEYRRLAATGITARLERTADTNINKLYVKNPYLGCLPMYARIPPST